MTTDSSPKPAFTDQTAEELPEYRRVSPLAVAALLVGVLSAVAMVGPIFWGVPGLGLLVGFLALKRLRSADPPQIGRGMAVAGLCLSLVFVLAAPTQQLLRGYHIRNQARTIGEQWLELVLGGNTAIAKEAQRSHPRRRLDHNLEAAYLKEESLRGEYEQFLNHPLIRTLRALPTHAEVRYYDTESIEQYASQDRITNVYAIRYFQDQRWQTFFVKLVIQRKEDPTTVYGVWRILSYKGGYRPQHPPE